MKGFGWGSRFIEKDWAEVRDWLGSVDWPSSAGTYLTDIIDSVVECGADEVLAVTTSMHDLVIAPKPPGEPPLDVVVVRAPGSLKPHGDDTVVIEHLAVSGRNTSSERPTAEAVPLFWRYVETEFGVAPRPTP